MSLNERKQKILKAVIDDYISFAEPVGSSHIVKTHDMPLSSATIRNELADLEEQGYLVKVEPHDHNVGVCYRCGTTVEPIISAIVDELCGEKIDIVKYSDDPVQFIGEALSPAKVVSVEIQSEDPKVCKASVPESQLSLAIGKEGQNARLAARLTGYKIDIKSETQAIESGELPANWRELAESYEEDAYYEEIGYWMRKD